MDYVLIPFNSLKAYLKGQECDSLKNHVQVLKEHKTLSLKKKYPLLLSSSDLQSSRLALSLLLGSENEDEALGAGRCLRRSVLRSYV